MIWKLWSNPAMNASTVALEWANTLAEFKRFVLYSDKEIFGLRLKVR